LARRWQSRLNLLLSQQEHQDENVRQQDEAAEELSDLLDLAGDAYDHDNDNMVVRFENRSALSGLRSMVQELNGDDAHNEEEDSDEEDNDAEEELDYDNMEEDETEEIEDHSGGDDDILEFFGEHDSDSDDFLSVAEEELEENDSVVMEDANDGTGKGQRATDQPRTVSMSSDDL